MAMEQRRARGRNVDRLSILDISLEDDTLLPLVAEESEASQPVQPVQDSACLVQENKPLVDSSTSNPVPVPAKELRKSKTRSSLRRSLAWDKAFLTGEGVLDLDELPISVRSSPKRLPELPHFDVGTKAPSGSGQVNSVAATAAPEPSLISSSKDDTAAAPAEGLSKITTGLRCQSERFDATRWKDSGLLSGQGLQKPAPEKSDAVSQLHSAMPPIPRPVPAKKVIESAIQKGTRLRLPSSLPRAEDKRNVLPLGTEKERTSSLTRKVSSVSRRVKDTLGKVLPGRSAVRSSVSAGEPTSPASTGRSSVSSSHSSLHSVDGIEGCASVESGVHNDETGSAGGEEASSTSLKEGSRYYLRSSTTGSRLNPLAKPTGLRMPSPKLGFFDPGKVLPAPQPPKPGGHAVRVANPSQQRTRPYGIPKSKPVAEAAHCQLRSSASSSAPSTPRKLNCDVLSPRGRSAVGSDTVTTPRGRSAIGSETATTPRGKLLAVRSSSKSARKLGLEDLSTCTASVSHCTSGDNAEIQQQPEIHESAAAELRSRDENAAVDAPAQPPGPAVKCPLADNHEVLNAAAEPEQQKEKNSFFAFAKRTVQRLSSSPLQENGSGQENRIPRKNKKTWTLGLPEAAARLEGGADSKEGSFVRTAPVQHSPPHKMAPEPSPWSPVKRNAGQLGPFDCTKSNARVEDVGWEVL